MSGGVCENGGVLGKEEYAQYKSQSIKLKSLTQICLGIGGSTFFGLLSVVAGNVLHATAGNALAAAAATLFSPAALAFVAIGVVSIYFGCKFMFEGQILDADFNTKKLGATLAQGKEKQQAQEKTVEQAIELAEPAPATGRGPMPMGFDKASPSLAETPAVAKSESKSESKWADKLSNASKSFQDRVQNADLSNAEPARA